MIACTGLAELTVTRNYRPRGADDLLIEKVLAVECACRIALARLTV